MKKVGSIVAVLVMSAWAVSVQGADRRALAEELLNVTKVPEMLEQSFAMMKQMIPAQMESAKAAMDDSEDTTELVTRYTGKMMDMIAEELAWDKLKDPFIAVYAETFTVQELQDTIAFYRTPSGQAFVRKQPELMMRSMEITQQRMMSVMPRIQALTEEMEAELRQQ